MAAKPIVINCLIARRDKGEKPYPATIMGWAYDPTVSVGGGPILPPDEVPPVDPPLETWPPSDAHPEHPIVLPPDVPDVPPDPPSSSTSPIKKNAWNWNDGSNPQYPNAGWYYVYVPGPGQPQPKK